MTSVTSARFSLLALSFAKVPSFLLRSRLSIPHTYAFLLIGSSKPTGRTGPRDSSARLYPFAAAFLETLRLFPAFRKCCLITRYPCTQIKTPGSLFENVVSRVFASRYTFFSVRTFRVSFVEIGNFIFDETAEYTFISSRGFLNTKSWLFYWQLPSNGKYNLHFSFFFSCCEFLKSLVHIVD